MPLETGTHISELNAANPPATDGLSQADDHLRKIKLALTTDFPNVAGAVTATHTALNSATALDPTGSPRTCDVGSLQQFPKVPSASNALGVGGVTTGGPFRYLEADGTTTWLIATYPALFAEYGVTFGGNGTTTFGVPNYKDTGRFLRSRTASVAVGTYQSSQNKSHTHTQQGTFASGNNSADHTHGVSGNTGGQSADHTHQYDRTTNSGGGTTGGGTVAAVGSANATSGTSNDHTHPINLTSGGVSAPHAHNVTISGATTTGSADGTEARPEAGVVIFAIKT